MQTKEKLFLFYLKTGGGHLAPAKAVATWLYENANSQIEPVLVDGFRETNFFIKTLAEDGYRFSQNYAKWIFQWLYAFNKIKIVAQLTTKIMSLFTKRFIKKMILEQKPDKIMIFHFFLIKPIHEVLKELNISIPVFTVVTDPYSPPPLWFLEPNQHFIVFSDKLKEKMLKTYKKPTDSISVVPFVVDKKFNTQMTPASISVFKQKLGIDNKKPTTLIMGGGDGIPNGKKILKHLINSKIDTNIIVVAGNNTKLQEQASKLALQSQRENIIVLGFVDYIYELLNISDIVISKCGASTFMETLLSKKIPVINSFVWEQEKGNVDFVTDNNLGIYEKNIKKLPKVVSEIIENDDKKRRFFDNISTKSIHNGTEELSRLVLQS